MRRLVLVVLALACAPTAAAADLTVVPRDFSPDEARLRIQAALPKAERVGIQLADERGRPLGWIVEPQRRRFLTLRWNGRLRGARVREGSYLIRLVAGSRRLASSPLRIDRTAPRVTDFNARNRSREPFQGDNERLTTISPNGDRLRDAAKIRFTLSERARVRFEVTRTISSPQTIYELTANLRPGRHTFTWHPAKTIGARTYLVRITTRDGAGNRRTYGADNAQTGRRLTSAVVRVLGVDAGFTGESYVASSAARLAIETDASTLTLQTFRAGPEDTLTHSDTLMNGVPVNQPVTIPWSARHRRATLNYAVGPWPTGVYFVKLTADDGRIGYAPFVVRPTVLGATSRVAVVMPTNTWQAYNFRDSDGNGWGDTWYAKGAQSTAALGRAYIRRGVPPQWRKYDVGFLRWLHLTGKQPELLTETDLESIRTAEELIRLYDFVIFPGHTEYATRHEFDLITELPRPRRQPRLPLREQLLLGGAARRVASSGERGSGAIRGARNRRCSASSTAPTTTGGSRGRSSFAPPEPRPGSSRDGLGDGSSFGQELGGYGIEIDQTTPFTPPGTIVLAEIPDLYGPGLTAQMTYYETPQGAKVFAGGAIDFGGTARRLPAVHRMLENLWTRLSRP